MKNARKERLPSSVTTNPGPQVDKGTGPRSWLLLSGLLLLHCGGDTFQLVGTVERTVLELAAPISEVIVELPVAVGSHVATGDVVVRLDSEVAEAELRASEAALAAAEATLAGAEQEFTRVEKLRQGRVASPQQLDNARRERDESRALAYEREARLAQARKRLDDLTVRASAPGVVDQLPYDVGERVPSGGVVGVVLADDQPWVRIWLPARAVGRSHHESRAEVEVEGFDETLHGRLGDVSREPEYTPHYALTEREAAHLVYEAKVTLDDAPADLRPGLPARVTLRFEE